MATFDDMDPERKITVYDKGFDESAEPYGDFVARSGDIWSPQVPTAEPLRLECEHFVACVRERPRRRSPTGDNGLAVVRVLEGPADLAGREPPRTPGPRLRPRRSPRARRPTTSSA